MIRKPSHVMLGKAAEELLSVVPEGLSPGSGIFGGDFSVSQRCSISLLARRLSM
jgi:hypothetical protein